MLELYIKKSIIDGLPLIPRNRLRSQDKEINIGFLVIIPSRLLSK